MGHKIYNRDILCPDRGEFMENIVFMIEKLIPDQMEVFARRYKVLKTINIFQPVGRRTIASYLDITERTVRGDIEKLAEKGLVTVSKVGINITENGIEIINGLEDTVKEYNGLSVLEKKVENILGIKKVHIVQGNYDENPGVKIEIGRVAGKVLMTVVNEESIIAVTGGTTVAAIVDGISEYATKKAGMVVPARGSVGRIIELQSDTLAARLAEKLSAGYRLLNIPDTMSSRALNEVMNEPSIKKTMSSMNKADILVFGLGEALEMAKKRRVSDDVYEKLVEKKAVAEAFGYYFNGQGDVVYESNSAGLSFDDLCRIPFILAAAGGKKKAQGIVAVCKNLPDMTIVIDEGAAKGILELKEIK